MPHEGSQPRESTEVGAVPSSPDFHEEAVALAMSGFVVAMLSVGFSLPLG